jgi:hypothetical protein
VHRQPVAASVGDPDRHRVAAASYCAVRVIRLGHRTGETSEPRRCQPRQRWPRLARRWAGGPAMAGAVGVLLYWRERSGKPGR